MKQNAHEQLCVSSESEIARQAAQMKLMRRLEKQALAQAAKEAKRQRGKLIIRCIVRKCLSLTGQFSI